MRYNYNTIIKLVLLMAILCESTQIAFARRNNNSSNNDCYHFAYASLAGGYSSLDESRMKDVATSGGFGGLIGVGYEMRVKHFWLSAGADIKLMQSQSIVSSAYKTQHDALDTQGKPITMHYDITNQTDKGEWLYVDVPLMVGGYYDMFYAGAGMKLGIPVKTFSSTKINYTTSATYNQYIDDFEKMDNHFYSNYDTLTTNNDSKASMNLALIGEIGVDVLAKMRSRSEFCNILKVGFYFEYGFLSIANKNDMNKDRVNFPSDNGSAGMNAAIITANPHFQWRDNFSYSCNPYFVGLKITYMFGGNKQENHGIGHRGCMCYE